MVITRTQELKKRSPAHIFHTFQVVGSEPELIFEKGKGIILTDTDGKDLLNVPAFNSEALKFYVEETGGAATATINAWVSIQ